MLQLGILPSDRVSSRRLIAINGSAVFLYPVVPMLGASAGLQAAQRPKAGCLKNRMSLVDDGYQHRCNEMGLIKPQTLYILVFLLLC